MTEMRFAVGLLLSAAVFSTGCNTGPKLVTVTGSVLKDKKPLELGPTGVVTVTLVPDLPPDSQYTPFPGRADATGKFVIEEVPVGRYKFVIEQMDPDPATDALRGAYSAKNSKIVREVDGKSEFHIDLAQEK